MPSTRRVKNVTAVSGTTAAERRVLAGVSAATAVPTTSSHGHLLQQNEYIHVLFALGGTNPVFRVRLYWFSEVSGRWHRGNQIVVNGDDCVLVESQGAPRVALVVEGTPSGTSPTLDAWLALVRPV
jgi:hypothetical protein